MRLVRFARAFGARIPVLALLFVIGCDDPFLAGETREYVDVATGGEHSCAVAESGEAYCWGRGTDGELGNGSTAPAIRPTRVSGSVTFVRITAGDAHTCALGSDGRVYCWGWGAFFQTGNLGSESVSVPTPVLSNERFTDVAAGAHHTCAISTDGRVFCWGYNAWGQNGDGGVHATAYPIQVAGDLRATAITAGGHHSCALTANGSAFCWGRNDLGQLGVASGAPRLTTPERVSTAIRFSDIDAGATHTCGIESGEGGLAYCWGSNAHGEVGDGAPWRDGLPGPAVPARVVQLEGVVEISAGVSQTCARQRTGPAWCWGAGAHGQLGDGNTQDRSVRQPVYVQPSGRHRSDEFRFSVLATGGATHACGIADGAVYCWGTGRAGQLGSGGEFVTLPLRVED